jgi:hypothetical protein
VAKRKENPAKAKLAVKTLLEQYSVTGRTPNLGIPEFVHESLLYSPTDDGPNGDDYTSEDLTNAILSEVADSVEKAASGMLGECWRESLPFIVSAVHADLRGLAKRFAEDTGRHELTRLALALSDQQKAVLLDIAQVAELLAETRYHLSEHSMHEFRCAAGNAWSNLAGQ